MALARKIVSIEDVLAWATDAETVFEEYLSYSRPMLALVSKIPKPRAIVVPVVLLGAFLWGCSGDSSDDGGLASEGTTAPTVSASSASPTTSEPEKEASTTTVTAPPSDSQPQPASSTVPPKSSTTPELERHEEASTTTVTAPRSDSQPQTAPSTVPPQPDTTPELERHEEAPHLFDVIGSPSAPDIAEVVVRSGPGVEYDEVSRIAVPRPVMEGTGIVLTDESGTPWRELLVRQNLTGWLDWNYLEINTGAQVSSYDFPCAVDGLVQGPVPVEYGSGDSGENGPGPADHIAQMWQLIGPGCDRLHIALGTEWDYASGGRLAGSVPAGVTVEAFGEWARITVPGLVGARSDATEDDEWRLAAYAAIATGDGGIVVDVHAPQPSVFAARVLSSPARLIVDVIPAVPDSDTSAPPAEPIRLLTGRFVAVPFAAPFDDDGVAGVTLPLTIRGYSRWFESAGDIILEHADGGPATATVTGSQVVNPGPGNRWGVTATGWLEAWGVFEFTVEDIEPSVTGEYRLFVGECLYQEGSGDCRLEGVTIPIRVARR